MKILYYYHDSCGLGDFYLLFPVFDSLRRKHKNDEITLLSSDKIKDVVTNKNWFDNFISISGAEYPMNRFDKIYNWDIQKLGITIFYPPKKHFWEIAEKNYDIVNSLTRYSSECLSIYSIKSETCGDSSKISFDSWSIIRNGIKYILH